MTFLGAVSTLPEIWAATSSAPPGSVKRSRTASAASGCRAASLTVRQESRSRKGRKAEEEEEAAFGLRNRSLRGASGPTMHF